MIRLDVGEDCPSENAEDLLTRAEASAYLARCGVHLKPATLARLWSAGANGPPCRHIRAKPYYPRGLLRAWAQTQIGDVRMGAPPAAQGRRRGSQPGFWIG